MLRLLHLFFDFFLSICCCFIFSNLIIISFYRLFVLNLIKSSHFLLKNYFQVTIGPIIQVSSRIFTIVSKRIKSQCFGNIVYTLTPHRIHISNLTLSNLWICIFITFLSACIHSRQLRIEIENKCIKKDVVTIFYI